MPLIAEMQAQKLLDDSQAKHKRAVVHHMLATRLRQQDRTDDALAQARKAGQGGARLRPGGVQAAELAQQLGRRRLALQLLEDCWRTQPHPDVAPGLCPARPERDRRASVCKRIDTRLAPLDQVQTRRPWSCRPSSRCRPAPVGHRSRAAGGRPAPIRPHASSGCWPRSSDSRSGDPAKAQEWLARATDAEPDRAWVCDDTGEVLPAWQPFSPSGRFDAVSWSTPPRVATMVGTEDTTYILPRGTDTVTPDAAAA